MRTILAILAAFVAAAICYLAIDLLAPASGVRTFQITKAAGNVVVLPAFAGAIAALVTRRSVVRGGVCGTLGCALFLFARYLFERPDLESLGFGVLEAMLVVAGLSAMSLVGSWLVGFARRPESPRST